jgi:cytochrome c-type biogenesis protein CcmH/NrfG
MISVKPRKNLIHRHSNSKSTTDWCKLGHYYLSQGRLAHAEVAFYYSLKEQEYNSEAKYGLGLTWLKQGFKEKAKKVFDRLIIQ